MFAEMNSVEELDLLGCRFGAVLLEALQDLAASRSLGRALQWSTGSRATVGHQQEQLQNVNLYATPSATASFIDNEGRTMQLADPESSIISHRVPALRDEVHDVLWSAMRESRPQVLVHRLEESHWRKPPFAVENPPREICAIFQSTRNVLL